MADRESVGGASSWLGSLAGIVVVALIGFAIYAYAGRPPQRTAQLELSVPTVKVNLPDLHLPAPPPAPTVPPQAQSTPTSTLPSTPIGQ